jgi:hypothetical protein
MNPMETGPKPKFWQRWKWTRLHQLLRDNRGVRYFAISLGLILAVGLGLLAWLWTQPQPQIPTQAKIPAKKVIPVKFYSPLTGAEVPDEAATKRQVTAIMIENSPDARPQSGLKDAGVVFEAIAEGGITRFIALYQEAQPGLIGPVRSVRPYYVEWASAFDAAVAHIGGSARALQMIRSGNYGVDLDQFFNAGAYWRAADRYAPHNVYTNSERMNALTAAKSKTSSNFTFAPRVDEKKAETPTATAINMAVSTGSYMVDYTYDPASNSYIRKQGGTNHVDREGGQIQPKVAIAMRVPMTLGFEDGYREQITTTGTGQAYIFQNGTVTEATWTKPDAKSQLKFTDAAGKEVPLVRGQTWITAVPADRNISWQ